MEKKSEAIAGARSRQKTFTQRLQWSLGLFQFFSGYLLAEAARSPRDVLKQAGGFPGQEGQFFKHSYENAIGV